jgi:hypothetical protein
VAADFDDIKAALTPRIIALAGDPDLAELLLRLEDHEEAWRVWMITAREWGAPESLAWREATAALEVAAAIYRRLAEPERIGLGPEPDWWEHPALVSRTGLRRRYSTGVAVARSAASTVSFCASRNTADVVILVVPA